MPRKSSKTAHVLNLLTSNKDNETSEFESQLSDEAGKKASAKKMAAKKADEPKPAPSAEPANAAPELDSIIIKSEPEQDVPIDVIKNLSIDEETVNAVKDEISPEIIDEIHISQGVEEMAEDIAEILLDNDTVVPEKPIYEMQTITPVPEYNTTAAMSEIQAVAAEAAETNADSSAPFSYVPPVQPSIMPSPMPKSAVASMLIAQRKADEKKEAELVHPHQEIAEETPVYENEDMTLVNLTEKAATKRIPDIMKKFNMCTCERCYYDVLALTLNGVPQKTVIISKDDIERKIAEYELDSTVDLITAISKSCVHVKISPRH